MKKSIRLSLLLFLISGLQLLAQPLSDKEIISEIKEFPYRAAGCYCSYLGGNDNTPAPAGYKPFYVSHVGRHGSRYQTGMNKISPGLDFLDTLHTANLLSAAGDSLRTEVQHIASIHLGREGNLTNKGTQEHMQIASRLVKRCPEIFSQKDRRTANFTSTFYQRTTQSMAGFSSAVIAAAPSLQVNIKSGFEDVRFHRDGDAEVSREEVQSSVDYVEKKQDISPRDFEQFKKRIFKNPQDAENFLGEKKMHDFIVGVLRATSFASCLDIQVDPLRFFTPEELFEFYKFQDARFNVIYGTCELTRKARAKGGKSWARRIVDEADAALEGNGCCADFRFAHDGNLGPLMNLLGIGPYKYTSTVDAPYRNWQSYRYICMASNLQLIFYRNASEDVLVKALYNEREIDFPGLTAINNVYYKWSDVRRYIISKSDDVKEVPRYYNNYLKEKSDQIARLQQDEADGFYFITDTHYPTNFGKSPALIESLEKSAGRRRVVFGGDILTYVNDMDDAVAMQISAIEQIRGAAPFYWVRGNHDMVNYTGKKIWITKERKALYQWESSELILRYTSKDVVTNPNAPYSSYYYYDNKPAKIRYVVIESTDDVSDNNIVYGINDEQLRWIAQEAVLSAPKGYHIMFFSHVPPVQGSPRSIAMVADLINALSSHKTFKVGDKTIDFAGRQDLSALGIVCGHKHNDYEMPLENGLYQINVAADCNYYRLLSGGSLQEQSFEYFSISKDYKTIRTVKIGAGKDREYKLGN